jgi:hypothetical protein
MKRTATIVGALVFGIILSGCTQGNSPDDIAAQAKGMAKPAETGGKVPEATKDKLMNPTEGAEPGKKNEALRGQASGK